MHMHTPSLLLYHMIRFFCYDMQLSYASFIDLQDKLHQNIGRLAILVWLKKLSEQCTGSGVWLPLAPMILTH